MSWWKVVLIILGLVAAGGFGFGYYMLQYAELDIYVPLFAENCGECHGGDLRGTDKGIALVESFLPGGDTVAGLMQSIRLGSDNGAMPAFANVLTEDEIKGLSIYVAERRLGQRFVDFRFDTDIKVPETAVHTEEYDFSIEPFSDGLDPMLFAIAPLPDGSFLLTEKARGLSIISADGTQSDPIVGTPKTGLTFDIRGVKYGIGWLLGVAPHPDYAENGWIYLHYTELCEEQCEAAGESSVIPKSMNRLDRGRIKDGQWVDVENIWHAEYKYYTAAPDTGAGGRIAFDDNGHVFISVGIKDVDLFQDGAQFLNSPYGKIYRVNDDGTIPADNPFVVGEKAEEGATFARQSIWTYGHRSPQGLAWNSERGRVWNAEMGPRGGDEINELLPGRNYGWPYHSLGLEYVGTQVQRYKSRDLEFDVNDVEMTLVDFTPSPAISSFAFYKGDRFPKWQNNILLGSLKGSSLFRLVFDGNKLVHKETLFKDLARIRDVEIGVDGLVYLLLENKHGSKIVRLVPSDPSQNIAQH